MVHIDGDIIIRRPVDAVFDCVADERNEPRYNPRLRHVALETPEPIGVGTRFRAVTSTIGRPSEMTIEFTRYDRPHLLASVTTMPAMDIAGTLTFEPIPAGTRMRWSWDLRPHGPARLLTPLIAHIGRRQERETWNGLKRYLEEPSAVSTQDRETSRLADRVVLTIEHHGNKWLRPLGAYLFRRTQGRIAPGEREVLLLTTTGRRSGRPHTVLVQSFRAGDDRVLVAANSGRPTDPDWYRNLLHTPEGLVETQGRTFPVHAQIIAADEAARLWPAILAQAPTYARYRGATSRTIPLVRLRQIERIVPA